MKLQNFEEFLNEKLQVSKEQEKQILPILEDYKKYLSDESNDMKHKKVLYVAFSGKEDKSIKELINNLEIPAIRINEAFKSREFFDILKTGNNQCIIFDDCPYDIIMSNYCAAMLKSISNENERKFAIVVPKDKDNKPEYQFNGRGELYFGGVVIILSNSKLKESYQKFFEYIEL